MPFKVGEIPNSMEAVSDTSFQEVLILYHNSNLQGSRFFYRFAERECFVH